ncbi:MAG: hypothetical protein J7578_24760 [Chitinophagaceae bacterium]|nr:hypothetical protein [Chitinophagaceae bacterium]
MIKLIIGLAIAVILGLYYFLKNFRSTNKAIKDIDTLKRIGTLLSINLEDCEIFSRQFSEQAINSGLPSESEMLDALGGKYPSNTEGTRSQIRYRHKENNGSYTDYISPVIYLEESLIRYRFMQQRTTIIYIDPNNKSHYYFDLEFLNKQ